MKIVGALVLFVVWVLAANLSVWVGSWAITHLGSGIDFIVVVSMPLLLFIAPALLMKRIAKSRGLQWNEVDGKKQSPSLLLHCVDSMLPLGIVCAFLLFFALPASAQWLLLWTGDAAEETTVEAAVLQHRDATYVSFRAARLLPGIVGSERQPTSGRDNSARDYAAPIVPRSLSKAEALARQPFRVWLGIDLKRQVAELAAANKVFGGVVLRGGSYSAAVQDAIARNGLKPIDKPMIIELGASTYAQELAKESLWALLGLGVFNLLMVALAGMCCRGIYRR